MLLMGAVVAVAVAGTGCADQSAAIRVGDDTVSEKDFREEVEALGQSETALQLMLGATLTDVAGELGDDSYTQPFIGYLVQQRVSPAPAGRIRRWACMTVRPPSSPPRSSMRPSATPMRKGPSPCT